MIYFYLKDGTYLHSHLDIPLNEVTVIISNAPAFKGVHKVII